MDKEKNKKMSKIVLILIVVIFITIIALIGAMMYIQKSVLKIYVDGKTANIKEGIILIGEEDIYIDIKGIAPYLGYDAHNGEYKEYSEDTNKCWVESTNETASYFLNSNKISKVEPNTSNDYVDYIIEDPVVSKNGKLYCTKEGIERGFNVVFNYSKQDNTIRISTLPHLVKQYTTATKNKRICMGKYYISKSKNYNI